MPALISNLRHLILVFASVLVAMVIGSNTVSWANETDLTLGKRQFEKSCAQCHGSNALGIEALGAPALAGQQARYLLRQLKLFQTGVRGSQDNYAGQMAAMANGLDDDPTQTNIAAYLSSLTNPQTHTFSGIQDQGKKQYQSSCGGCHGRKAQGNDALNAPRLAGIQPSYLKRQYQHFLTGKRGTDKSDRLGRQMMMMANTVSNKDQIDNVLAFIGTLNDLTKETTQEASNEATNEAANEVTNENVVTDIPKTVEGQ